MTLPRRDFIQQTALASSAITTSPLWASASEKKPARLCDVGWVWEGQGLDPGVPPSIYGLGQGAAYFGLQRVNMLFHPTDNHALEMLKGMTEVTCDITKWVAAWEKDGKLRWDCPGGAVQSITEAQRISALSKQYTNITGAFFDDLKGRMKKDGFAAGQFEEVYAGVKSANPDLKLWTVLYAHELKDEEFWKPLVPFIDIVNLWIWKSKDLQEQERHIQQCRELFPEKPIIMGCYLRDYSIPAPIPVKNVLAQINNIADSIGQGLLQGFSILASVLIDSHRPQAEAVRDFIAANS